MDQETANKATTAVITPASVEQRDPNAPSVEVKAKKNPLRIPLAQCRTYEPLMLAGANLGKHFGLRSTRSDTQCVYDIRLNMVLITYKKCVAMVPVTAVTGMEPMDAADIGVSF
jgi:hypothetical protein